MSQILYNNNTDSFNVEHSFNVTNYFTSADERSEILAWLSPLVPRRQHRDIQAIRVGSVGDWFLETHEFSDWCASSGEDGSDGAALFCYGNLGVGKTCISSLVIDELDRRAGAEGVPIVCSYYDFDAQGDQSPIDVLGSLLQQLVTGLDNFPPELVGAFRRRKNALGGKLPELDEIVTLFRTIASSRRAFICIDALDECAPKDRGKLLRSLGQILQGSPGTRLFLTGRPYIQSEIEERLREVVAVVAIATNKGDVIGYLRARLEEDTTPDAMDSSLEADIVTRVTGSMSKIFRLVSLGIGRILREKTIHRRRRRLNGIPNCLDLGDVYGATMERISVESESMDLVLTALMWVCYSERPLRVDELRYALAVEIGSTDFEVSNVLSEKALLHYCQGLVIVDKESSTAHLIHPTLREYLRTHPDSIVSAHSAIAEACLTYLNSQQVKDLLADTSPNLRDAPFLHYASRYWGTHAKMELSDDAKSLALQLFNKYNGHISATILLQQVCNWDFVEHDPTSVFTGLHCASFFGITEVVKALMRKKICEINQRDCVGVTPLIWAAMCGHEAVVKLLLGQEGVDPNISDKSSSRTALSWAIENGHEGVMRLLLEREDVNPEKPANGRILLACSHVVDSIESGKKIPIDIECVPMPKDCDFKGCVE